MTSLLEKLNCNWEDYNETGKLKFLSRLKQEYVQLDYYTLMGASQEKSYNDNLQKVNQIIKSL